jgi:predicted HAD superfamily Cof-like phosphohydrolase
MTPFEMITQFHRAYGQAAPDHAITLPPDVQELRYKLIDEEYREYEVAVNARDLVAIADALADLVYVVVGTAVAHGLTRFDEIFAEVHRSNMSKLGADGKPVIRADGKILKGPSYTPPNLGPLLP